nr:hypothetical protein GCM10020093_013840 [Planobispora longispora]
MRPAPWTAGRAPPARRSPAGSRPISSSTPDGAWPSSGPAPRLALGEIFLLNASNAALIRQAWRTDRTAGAILLPYGAWTLFATALNTAIVRRNPAGG